MDDRDIDALVAEKVMGWTSCGVLDYWEKDASGEYTPCDPQPPESRVGCPPGIFDAFRRGEVKKTFDVIPFYSTDFAAAFDVVQRILNMRSGPVDGRGGMTDVKVQYNPYRSRWEVTFNWSNDVPEMAFADTVPRAICLAALKAVGVESPAN